MSEPALSVRAGAAVRAGAPRHAPAPERAPQQRRPPLRVVARPRRLLPVGAAAAVLVFVAAFVLVVLQTALVAGQERLDDLDARLSDATADYQRLRSEVATLESPDRVVGAAADLGMVPPPSITYLTPSGALQVDSSLSAAIDPDLPTGARDDLVAELNGVEP